jgi:hypothetical protein
VRDNIKEVNDKVKKIMSKPIPKVEKVEEKKK